MPSRPARRAVLTAGVGIAVATALGACGIRLEDDAPDVPLVPRRKPVPGEAFLVSTWHSSKELADLARADGGATTGLPARLSALHGTQATVLRSELVHLGVPQHVMDAAAASATASATTTTTTPAATGTAPAPTGTTATTTGPPTTAELADAELAAAGPEAIGSLARLGAQPRTLVGALLAQRTAAATLLGARVPASAPTWQVPSLAASFLESTRPAVYAFEVVTAQSPKGAQRTLADATLSALQARAQVQESLAGASAGPPDLGYPLPFAVTTPAAARKLAVHVMTELRAANARELEAAGDDAGPLASVVHWLADTEVLASRWGVALAPFPGLS